MNRDRKHKYILTLDIVSTDVKLLTVAFHLPFSPLFYRMHFVQFVDYKIGQFVGGDLQERERAREIKTNGREM